MLKQISRSLYLKEVFAMLALSGVGRAGYLSKPDIELVRSISKKHL